MRAAVWYIYATYSQPEIIAVGRKRLPPEEHKKTPRLTLCLRTQQVDYLEYIAERDDIPLSRAFWSVLDRHAEIAQLRPRRPSQKAMKHLTLDDPHRAILERLSVRFGIPLVEVSRRVIDEALASDGTIRGT